MCGGGSQHAHHTDRTRTQTHGSTQTCRGIQTDSHNTTQRDTEREGGRHTHTDTHPHAHTHTRTRTRAHAHTHTHMIRAHGEGGGEGGNHLQQSRATPRSLLFAANSQSPDGSQRTSTQQVSAARPSRSLNVSLPSADPKVQTEGETRGIVQFGRWERVPNTPVLVRAALCCKHKNEKKKKSEKQPEKPKNKRTKQDKKSPAQTLH